MLTKKKKIFMLAGMILLLAATVWLNAMLAANAKDSPGNEIPVASSYADFRARRELTRTETISYLDSVLETTSEEFAEDRATAMNQKLKLIAAMEQEVNIETLLRAQGFDEVGVTIGVTTDIVTVVVATQDLTLQEKAIIYNIFWEQAEISAENISIFPM